MRFQEDFGSAYGVDKGQEEGKLISNPDGRRNTAFVREINVQS